MQWYYLGCAALGLTAGVLVGASNSPVVQYVLPLLFALIGTGAGVIALKSSQETTVSKFKIMGATTLCLTIPFLVAAIYASLVRTDGSLSTLVIKLSPSADSSVFTSSEFKQMSVRDKIQSAVFSSSLQSLELDRDASAIIIKELINTRREKVAKFYDTQEQIKNSITKLLEELSKIPARPSSESSLVSNPEALDQEPGSASSFTIQDYILSLKLKVLDMPNNIDDRAVDSSNPLEDYPWSSWKSEMREGILKVSTLPSETIALINSTPNITENIGELLLLLKALPAEFIDSEMRAEINLLSLAKKVGTQNEGGPARRSAAEAVSGFAD